MELAHADFTLQLLMWRHSLEYKHHKDAWADNSSLSLRLEAEAVGMLALVESGQLRVAPLQGFCVRYGRLSAS
jgi:hypothetical protein